MKPRIKTTNKKLPKIVDKSEKASKIKESTVANALGGRVVSNENQHKSESPFHFFAFHQELYSRLRSTGGRKSLEGTTRRQKIPLSEEDWEALQKLAEEAQNEEIKPSPAQVASVLLHQALKEMLQKSEKG